jgi:hypothetical protein
MCVGIEIQIIFLCVGGFLIIYFIAVACQLTAVSSRLLCLKSPFKVRPVDVSTVVIELPITAVFAKLPLNLRKYSI